MLASPEPPRDHPAATLARHQSLPEVPAPCRAENGKSLPHRQFLNSNTASNPPAKCLNSKDRVSPIPGKIHLSSRKAIRPPRPFPGAKTAARSAIAPAANSQRHRELSPNNNRQEN